MILLFGQRSLFIALWLAVSSHTIALTPSEAFSVVPQYFARSASVSVRAWRSQHYSSSKPASGMRPSSLRNSLPLMSSSKSTTEKGESKVVVQKDDDLDMPWSDVQDWALRDNLAKFTTILPSSITGSKPKKYAMWRTLTREVPELAGYPIPFLRKMHQRALEKDAAKSNSTSVEESPGVLPMVDDFEFASNGGIVGRAYGIPGVADGTRIQTPPLIAVENTVPLGYVITEEVGDNNDNKKAGFSYELGTCASSSAYSLDGSERSAALLSARRLVVEGVVGSSAQLASTAKDMAVSGSGLLTDSEANRDLAYLGGATALLLASATAVGALSHHLTVNVFWV